MCYCKGGSSKSINTYKGLKRRSDTYKKYELAFVDFLVFKIAIFVIQVKFEKYFNFGIDWVHRIRRLLVKKWAHPTVQLLQSSLVFLGCFWENIWNQIYQNPTFADKRGELSWFLLQIKAKEEGHPIFADVNFEQPLVFYCVTKFMFFFSVLVCLHFIVLLRYFVSMLVW